MRTALYAAVIAVVGGVMIHTLATRHFDGIDVIHDRNPLFVHLSDGAIRNGYTIRVLNKTLSAESYVLSVSGLSSAELEVIGSEGSSGSNPIIYVGPDQSREMRVLVTTHEKLAPHASIALTFGIAPAAGGAVANAADHFLGP